MARTSPGVRRVAAILNFMADHPGQAFTLTDLLKALKLSRATCHALLTSLVEVGYLYRSSDKHYVLGPALVAIGRTAAEHASAFQIAQPEMRALADEFDVLCLAVYRDGDELVLAERAASVSNLGGSDRRGSRLRLHPPPAALFFARSSLAEIDAWLEAYTPPVTAEERDNMFKVLSFIRAHGFAVHVKDPPRAEGQPPTEQFGPLDQRNFPITLLTELEPSQQYELLGLTAPVFEADGKVAFVLTLSGLASPADGAEIERIGRRLREACDRITTFIVGRRPQFGRGARGVAAPEPVPHSL